MRILLAFAISVAAGFLPAIAARPAAFVFPAKMPASLHSGDRVVDQFLKSDPVGATQLGDHRYDALLPDASAAGRAAHRVFAEQSLAELARFDTHKLSREHQVDAILLKDQLNYLLFSNDRLQDWAWDPLTYAYSAGTAFFTLSSREFAPWSSGLSGLHIRLDDRFEHTSSRSFSWGYAMESNVRMASRSCQPGCERVQTQPTLGIQTHEIAVDHGPPGARPALSCCAVRTVGLPNGIAFPSSQSEVHPLRRCVRGIEHFLAFGCGMSMAKRSSQSLYGLMFQYLRAPSKLCADGPMPRYGLQSNKRSCDATRCPVKRSSILRSD